MKILIENSGYHLCNMGDLAMLQVSVERLQNLWGNASIKAFTTAPDKLGLFCPDVSPLPDIHYIWNYHFINRAQSVIQTIDRWIPSFQIAQKWSEYEGELRHHFPSLLFYILKRRYKNLQPAQDIEVLVNSVYEADLIVASGGGYITDSFERHCYGALSILGLANKLGKPTVMLGQGLGPIQNQKLFAKAKTVLPTVNLIGLREKRVGMSILNSICVSSEQIITTGDDAIELAYKNRNPELGYGIGVNLRVAQYSDINLALVATVRSALQDTAKQYDAPLLPIPIDHTFYEGYAEPDSVTIQQILKGYDDSSDGGKSLNTPLEVIKQVGRCRVVVTGSYHAGVFALAQGIPVIGLAKSQYYKDKFFGLADQFGIGCEVLFLDDNQLKEKLMASIHNAWQSIEQLRPQLLEAAWQQIDMGHTAYKRVFELVQSR